MKIVAVVGLSESGKTRLITRLIGELKRRGLRTCAVKRCSHGFSLDTEGKDSSDFTKAGADGVAMISPEGWAALSKSPAADVEVLASRLFPTADVVLVEGGKAAAGLPKIEVLRAGLSDVLVSRPGDLLAVVADFPLPDGLMVPIFRPEAAAEICDLILNPEEGNMAEIKLEVDGREVNLNPFVRTFIEKTILGMVTSLSGVDPEPNKISLIIERGDAAGKKG